MTNSDILRATYDGSPNLEHIRNPSEINARYQKSCSDYKALMRQRVDPREQRVMLSAEIRVLAWILGKSDSQMQKDMGA